jgi:hypothetical protein
MKGQGWVLLQRKNMSHPTPSFPVAIWDGLTENIDRINIHSNVNPDSGDWDRAVAEIVALQDSPVVILPTITNSGPIVVVDADGNQFPLTTSAILFADALGGEVVIDLPAASTMNGKTLTVKKIDVSANLVILDAAGAETIDGNVDLALADQYISITLVSIGTEWFII